MHPSALATRKGHCRSLKRESKVQARYHPVKVWGLFVAKLGKLFGKIAHAWRCRALKHEPATQNFLQSTTAKFPSLMPKCVGIVMNQNFSTHKQASFAIRGLRLVS